MDSIETVYHAIAILNGSDSTACSKASIWLGEFQKSVYSWSICDRILSEHRDSTASYFAAQTMRQKLLHSMKELPSSSHLSLRDSLINHLRNYESYPLEKNSVIITQLCLALSDLYLQVPEWTNFVAEILERFGTPDKTPVLLTFLKTLPEEVQSSHLRIGENRRRIVNTELAQKTQAVIHFLSQVCIFNGNDDAILKKVLSCFSSWLLNPLIPTDDIATSDLLKYVFSLLQNPNSPNSLHDSACECIVSALYRAEDTNVNRVLAMTLQSACYGMADSFSLAVANDDFDRLQGYARVFCELSESLLECMIQEPGQGLGDFRSIEMLLLLAGYHDYNLVEMTFNIWYRLSEYLYERNDDDLNAQFKPYIERYIMALYKHCRFDTDQEDIPDENDDFVEFRSQVSDTLKDVVFIVGTDRCIQSMFSILQSVSSGSWDESEAALYIISVIVHNVLPTEETVVPLLIQAVLVMPVTSHPILTNTSIKLLGNLIDWLHENKQYQEPCVTWLLDKVRKPCFVRAASESLYGICGKCESNCLEHFDSIFAIIPLLESGENKGQQLENSILLLLQACSSMLNGLPGEETATRLRRLVEPQMTRLTALLKSKTDISCNESQDSNENASDSWHVLSRDPVLWVDRIAAIFRHVQPWTHQAYNPKNNIQNGSSTNANDDIPALWITTVKEVWPFVLEICKKYEKNTRVVEHCCRAIRFMIRFLEVHSITFIESLVEQMVDIYNRHPHSCFLYLASILVDEYGHLDNCRSGLVHMLNILCNDSFKLLQEQNGFRNHPDTIDDMFRLAIRFVQRAPSVFFQEPMSAQLFECGLVGLDVDHVDANRSITKFFSECVTSLLIARKSNYRDAGVEGAEQLFVKYGEKLISGSLQAAVFSVSGTLKRDMAEIIYLIGKLSKEQLSIWLKATLEKFPHNGGLYATIEQLEWFHKNVLESTDLRQVYAQIRDLIRLYKINDQRPLSEHKVMKLCSAT
ncbi:Transportin-3 [Dirofilaria immitis]